MNTLTMQIPDALLAEANEFVARGYFSSSSDVLVAALAEFVRHYRPELTEQFTNEDIEWAKGLKRREKCNS